MPEQLGRYRIERELGQGAMGRVYLGHDPAIDRLVALKVIHLPQGLPQAERKEAEERFHREIRAAGKLSHPNIVTVHDVGHDDVAGTFVAMEYVEGQSLEETIGSGTLPAPRIVASVGCQAADALAYAHRNGIVHRDIKPANLMLVGEQSVKITDFGLAKPSGTNLTTDGALLGTPYYMSPEQVEGRAVDGRSDLFSLAVVIYQLLTGKLPFRGDSISTVVYRILHEPPVAPDLGQLSASSEIKNFLGRALAKDPDQRFKDGDAFARALREAMSTSDAARPAPGAGAEGKAAAPRPAGASAKKKGPARRRDNSRQRPPARRRRSPTLFPVVVIFTILAAMGFIYRDALFDQFQAWTGLGAPEAVPPGEIPQGNQPPVVPPLDPGEGSGESADAAMGQEQTAAPGAGQAGGQEPATDADDGAGAVTDAGSDAAPVEAPPPAAAPAGGVRLISDPEGASFSVSGGSALPAGMLPVPGQDEKVVVVAALGCQAGSQEISAADAGQVVTIPLQAEVAKMRIEAKPGRAEVRVDGDKQGRTPLTVELDACSEHEVKVSRAEYKTWTRVLALEDGRLQAPEVLTATLEALPRGTLQLPTPPYPVTMTLPGGRPLKAGDKLSLVANTYRVKFVNDALLLRKEVKVRIPANKTVTPDMVFPPLARLTVQASPSNVQITVRAEGRSRDLGAPPIIREEILAGTYTLHCRFQHNGEEQEKVVTLAGGENPPVKFIAGRP